MAHGLLLPDVDGPLNPYAANRCRGLRVWLHPGHGEWSAHLARVREWASSLA